MENFQYNTQLEPLIQKEYGRNVQKLAAHLLTIADREKRTRLAHVLIELMREIHPNMREGEDYTKKLWDDLYILTGFDLDVDSPYRPPEKTALGKKPQLVPYPNHEFKYKQYGYQVVQLIERAAEMTNQEEQLRAVAYIGRLMKTFNQTWTDKNIEDEVIVQQLREISKGRISLDMQTVRTEGLFEAEPSNRRMDARNDNRNDRNRSQGLRNEGRNDNRDRGDNQKKDKFKKNRKRNNKGK
ncbi:MAG: DUF4290 domain-containing protein [Cytophagales bacterium]|jgi:hypothetical protein|nr:DUF4290 domain-containing protein [Cytophagales bacterium]